MLVTLSRLSPEKDNKAFWDRWAERYDRAMSGDKDTYSRILNRMKRKLNSNMTVLELACGKQGG